MLLEFIDHPLAVKLTLDRVMQHMHPDEAGEEIVIIHNVFMPIS